MNEPIAYIVTASRVTESGGAQLWKAVAYLTRNAADTACQDCMEKRKETGTFVKRYPLFTHVVEQWENDKWIVCILRLVLEG